MNTLSHPDSLPGRRPFRVIRSLSAIAISAPVIAGCVPATIPEQKPSVIIPEGAYAVSRGGNTFLSMCFEDSRQPGVPYVLDMNVWQHRYSNGYRWTVDPHFRKVGEVKEGPATTIKDVLARMSIGQLYLRSSDIHTQDGLIKCSAEAPGTLPDNFQKNIVYTDPYDNVLDELDAPQDRDYYDMQFYNSVFLSTLNQQ